jgi:hypothetical protein
MISAPAEMIKSKRGALRRSWRGGKQEGKQEGRKHVDSREREHM